MKYKIGLFFLVLLIFALLINIYFFSPTTTSRFSQYVNESFFYELQGLSIVLIYLFSALFLHIEKESLQEFYLDRMGLLLFIGSSLFTWFELKPLYYLIVIALAGWMFYSMTTKWSFIKKTNSTWMRLSIFYTLLAVIPATIIILISVKTSSFESNTNIPSMLGMFVFNVGLVSAREEFLFRCLFLGYLNKTKMQLKYNLIIQFILFWLLHYNINSLDAGFFVSLPIIIFVYSFLAFKSKQLTPSILSHALYNTLAPILWRLF